jgi:hypothetical protein
MADPFEFGPEIHNFVIHLTMAPVVDARRPHMTTKK